MFPSLRAVPWIIALLGFVAAGCSKKTPEDAKPQGSVSAAATKESGPITLQGSGASFPAPLYSRWFREFNEKTPEIRVNYQSTGSGAGIRAFSEGQTDFGASDAAMTDEEIKKVDGNVVLLPMTAGTVVISYNLEGISSLKLSRDAYVGIFLGAIKKWNDPKIAASNPGTKLPATEITTVHRSDGSGTNFVFTQHLAAISDKWKNGPGVGKSIQWPTGVGGSKNDGVAALLKRTPGSIGYVEYAYAVSSKLPMAQLENKSGKYIEPDLKTSEAALAAVELPADLRAWVTDPAGEDAYPIVTYTWILAHKKYDDKAKADALKKVLKWCLTDGQKLSEGLDYVPLPEKVSTKVLAAVDTIQP